MTLRLAEARELLAAREWKQLAARAEPLPDDALRAEPELAFLCASAWLRTGAIPRALALLAPIEPEVRLSADRRLSLQLTNLLGALWFESGRVEEADLLFSELLERACDWGDAEYVARACNNLGILANVRGEHDRALALYQRALAAYHRLPSLRGLAQTHYNVGIAYRELGFPSEAEGHYDRAAQYAERSRSEDVLGLAESDRGLLCIQTGDPRKGFALARLARERFERLGDPVRAAEAARVQAAAARATGQAADAEALLREALLVATHHENLLLLAETHRDLGVIRAERGDAGAALDHLRSALTHFTRLGAAAEVRVTHALSAQLSGDAPPPPPPHV